MPPAGRRARRPQANGGPTDQGSASIWTIAVALAVLAIGCAAMSLAAAVSLRHRAEAAADLAALAGATALRDGGDGCAAALRVAVDNRARLSACMIAPDASVTVTVAVALPTGLRRWAAVDVVRAVARAGP
jgi:secretion/DNA translocation related TadE-like protein